MMSILRIKETASIRDLIIPRHLIGVHLWFLSVAKNLDVWAEEFGTTDNHSDEH
jgi:hypothetical protein